MHNGLNILVPTHDLLFLDCVEAARLVPSMFDSAML